MVDVKLFGFRKGLGGEEGDGVGDHEASPASSACFFLGSFATTSW